LSGWLVFIERKKKKEGKKERKKERKKRSQDATHDRYTETQVE
jgi:hypothetical protein